MKILLTNGEWKGSLACMRSFASKGHSVALMSNSSCVAHLHSKYCSEMLISPNPREKEKYFDFVLSQVSQRKYDLLIPMSDITVEIFSSQRDKLAPFVNLVLPPCDCVDIVSDKKRFYKFALQNNILIPQTFFPENLNDVEVMSRQITFPCLIKDAVGAGGQGKIMVNDVSDLHRRFRNLQDGEWPVIQEYMEMPEGNFAAVCNDGKILGYHMYESLRQTPHGFGVNVYSRSFFREDVLKASADIIQKLRWTGPINFDFLMSHNERYYCIDVNPRFPGSLQICCAAGVDLPRALLDLAIGEKKFVQPEQYKRGLIYRSVFPQEIQSCLERKRFILDFFVNFFKPNTCYDFSIFDPVLLWWQVKCAKWDVEASMKKDVS